MKPIVAVRLPSAERAPSADQASARRRLATKPREIRQIIACFLWASGSPVIAHPAAARAELRSAVANVRARDFSVATDGVTN